MTTKEMVLAALFAAIIAVLGLLPPIPLPFTPVPVTAQTLGVMLAGSFLGMKLGGMSTGLFVLLIVLGAPILAGGRGGLSVFASPSGGFVLSYPFAAMLMGYMVERLWVSLKIWKLLCVHIFGGILFIYGIGAPYQAFITDVPIEVAFLASAGFLPGDLLKAVLAAVVVYQIRSFSPIEEKRWLKEREQQAA
ncbi:biotin transporter BioY [Salsuginibacillus kocurii]|uniref:biotin transporter BioY n=1 Tax=Salsuginibacillus kocurii TaxID=427078 RepID=UPI0003725C18|nr:biotin transporter BioY [Salsuginibacillus kocurii]